MANSIKAVRLIMFGGTTEDQTALTDAFSLLLVEHGISIESMQQWDNWDGEGDPPS